MFEFLGAHPEIYPCAVKEPKHFARDETGYSTGEAEYLQLFAGATNEKWLLEASPYYLVATEAPARIRLCSPEARFVVMLRNPVEMVQSYHRLLVHQGRESLTDLASALRREDRIVGNAPLTDGLRYKRWARYGEQLERLLSIFPRAQVHVIVYDDFARDVPAAYRGVLEFLDVHAQFTPRFRVVNATMTPRSDLLQAVLWRRSGGLVHEALRATIPERLRRRARRAVDRLNSRPVKLEPIAPEPAFALWRELEPDVTLLSDLLGRDFVQLWNPR